MELKQIKNERVIGKKGKNKKHFCIYTPEKISDEIVNTALSLYFKDEIDFKLEVKLENLTVIEKLEKIKAIDLSCGNGGLLIPFLIKLLEISKEIYGKYRFFPHWISGYDIDEEALKSLKNSIYIILKERCIENADELLKKINIKKLDSLTCSNETYNIILGNPPYFGEKNHKEIFDKIRETEFGQKFYEGKMDYLYFFIEKGIELLEKNGILTYITTNYWFKADSGKKLRNYIKENTRVTYINDINNSVFEYAPGQHNTIFSLKKTDDFLCENRKRKILIFDEGKELRINCDKIYDSEGKIRFGTEEEFNLSKEILRKKSFFLEEYFEINQGIVSGLDEAFVFKQYNSEFSQFLKPFYKNKDINKYSVEKKNQFWIMYNIEKNNITESLKNYLFQYKERLDKRREVATGQKKWWELTWKRKESIFTKPSIVVRQRCKENIFAYTEGEFYGSADIYYITPKTDEINIFYVLGYLNSEIFFKWYKLNGKYKGVNLEFYSTPLKLVPIVYPKNKKEIKKIEILVKKQILEYSVEVQKELNEYFKLLLE